MKVYLRSEWHGSGAYIGDAEPGDLMDVFAAVKEASVYDGNEGKPSEELSHQIVYEPGNAYFEIIFS